MDLDFHKTFRVCQDWSPELIDNVCGEHVQPCTQREWKNTGNFGYHNKYRVLRSCNSDHLNQRVPGGTDRTEGMARISWINQMGPQKLKFQVS